MNKAKHSAKPNRKTTRNAKSKQRSKAKTGPVSQTTAQTDCPYRAETLYAILFTEGNRDYIGKAELIKRVAELTGKSEKVVGFAYDVLKSKTHRSNKNRSTELTEGDKVKLIAIRKT
jgi:hypothetical protein